MAKARFNNSEINELIQTLQRLTDDWEEIAGRAVYEGSAIIADKVKANIHALPVTDEWGTQEHPRHGVTEVEKQGLIDGLGIADMLDSSGFLNTMIGYDDGGYNRDGKANRMIARAVQSGTSFSDKIPFFNNAVRATKGQAEQKMKEVLEQEIENITGR